MCHCHLAVALAAKRHTAPIARTARIAPRLQMGALNHLDAVIGRVLDQGARLKSVAHIQIAGDSAGESQEAKNGKGEGSELHLKRGGWLIVRRGDDWIGIDCR